MYKNTVPIERLNELLAYDPATGLLTWKLTRNGRIKAGANAGSMDKRGYIVVRIDFVQYGAHRVGWALHFGAWPAADIDHINGNRADNRIENLRDVSRSVNAQNQRRAHRDNKTGYLGVDLRNGLYNARIKLRGRTTLLGSFPTAEDASAAYQAAKLRLHDQPQGV